MEVSKNTRGMMVPWFLATFCLVTWRLRYKIGLALVTIHTENIIFPMKTSICDISGGYPVAPH
jgi:hypothetical protein